MADTVTTGAVCAGYEEYDDGDWIIELRENGVLVVTMNRPRSLNAMTYRLHTKLAAIWPKIDADPRVKVVVITGAGRAFSAGADLKEAQANPRNASEIIDMMYEATRMVYGMINMSKPIISAINGAAVGSGAATALLADISIAADDAVIMDGHTTNGAVSGDHAVMLWPLLCGMAKSKYLLMLNERISGAEAERLGIVSLSVPGDKLMETALGIADRLAGGSQQAIRGTKRALNHWLRQAGPAFEHSLTLEMLDYHSKDLDEGRAAFADKRDAVWRDG
jgi:enoyl-CoA hydratase